MDLKEKPTKFTDKITDTMFDVRMTYEKNCRDIDCYSLSNVRETTKVKAMIDKDRKYIEFSGVLEEHCKHIRKPWFFLTTDGDCFVLKEETIKQETINVAMKSKTEKFVITTALFRYRKLALITT